MLRMNAPAEVAHTTQLLLRIRQGADTERADASNRLLEVLYGELRSLAGSFFRRQSASHTLQPTALVHEVWMRLVDSSMVEVVDRAHFLALAATAMRHIL